MEAAHGPANYRLSSVGREPWKRPFTVAHTQLLPYIHSSSAGRATSRPNSWALEYPMGLAASAKFKMHSSEAVSKGLENLVCDRSSGLENW